MAPTEATPQPLQARDLLPAERVLFDLLALDLNRRWLPRTARTFAWLLTAYTSVPFLFLGARAPLFAQFTLRQNLITLSCLAGVASLAVAAPQAEPGAAALARLRGIPLAALSRVQWAAACNVPFKVLAPAGLVISGLSIFRSASWSEGAHGLLTLVGALCYALFATGALGLCALWARRMSPTKGRLLFVLGMLLPVVLERALPLTSIPTVLGQVLTLCLNFGGPA